jgi:hypothetical protein
MLPSSHPSGQMRILASWRLATSDATEGSLYLRWVKLAWARMPAIRRIAPRGDREFGVSAGLHGGPGRNAFRKFGQELAVSKCFIRAHWPQKRFSAECQRARVPGSKKAIGLSLL